MTAMAREMAEQPGVIGALLDRREEFAARLRAIAPEPLTGVILIARGSSDNAAIYGRYVLEAALRRPVSLAAPSLWTRYGLSRGPARLPRRRRQPVRARRRRSPTRWSA